MKFVMDCLDRITERLCRKILPYYVRLDDFLRELQDNRPGIFLALLLVLSIALLMLYFKLQSFCRCR